MRSNGPIPTDWQYYKSDCRNVIPLCDLNQQFSSPSGNSMYRADYKKGNEEDYSEDYSEMVDESIKPWLRRYDETGVPF